MGLTRNDDLFGSDPKPGTKMKGLKVPQREYLHLAPGEEPDDREWVNVKNEQRFLAEQQKNGIAVDRVNRPRVANHINAANTAREIGRQTTGRDSWDAAPHNFIDYRKR